MYLAHLIYEDNGNRREQTLREHNRHVAFYASDCLKSIGLSSCGYLAGLLHDGKGTEKFQEYLENSAAWDAFDRGIIGKEPAFRRPERGSVNHTFAGVIYFLDQYHYSLCEVKDQEQILSNITAEMIACAIGSHHGLFDCQSLDGKNGFDHRVHDSNRNEIQYEQAKSAFERDISSVTEIERRFENAKQEVKNFLTKLNQIHLQDGSEENYLGIGLTFAERLITSALIYADRRDTAEFSDLKTYPDIPADWSRDIEDFEAKYHQLTGNKNSAAASAINDVRSQISEQCRDFSEQSGGIYRLNVPTGGGKTLSSLRYALYHAKKYDKKRIIYVIPLLTILDQNAKDIEEYLPQETILEHHSDVAIEKMSKDELEQYDLEKDRWSAPVIVTTLVQILEILFSAKTASVARMRALCDSVMIFDEVQSVPLNMLSLFNVALNFLADFCRSTIILCSATQPEFDCIKDFPLHILSDRMVSLTETQEKVFQRQKYHDLSESGMSIEELADFALELVHDKNPLMIVCNTKSEAKKLYTILQHSSKELCLKHLSAGMCKAHRKIVLDEIRQLLLGIQKGELIQPFILVTTQLVEAGVNLSFRSVIRILAGNDNLIQSGGRCNRSNEYGEGDVYLIRLEDEDRALHRLPEIMRAQDALLETIHYSNKKQVFDPEKESFISGYYKSLFSGAEDRGETGYKFHYRNGEIYALVNLLNNELSPSKANENYCLNQPFKTAGTYFSVFGEETYSVLVPYRKGAEIIHNMQELDEMNVCIPVSLLRKAGDYIVQIYDWQKKQLEGSGMLTSLADGKIFVLNEKSYSDSGIEIGAEYQIKDLII